MPPIVLSEAIQRYRVPWVGLDWPICWEEVFGRDGELVVEIGFGSGRFLEGLARGDLGVNFVGIERSWGSVQRLFKRLSVSGLENVLAVHGDASYTLARLFAPDSIGRVYVNFPDPWHKERHHSRRLIQADFVRLIGERLVFGGEVTIATDQAEYARWIGEVLEGQSLLVPAFGSTSVTELEGRRPTRYEQKALLAGGPIYYFVWRREGVSSFRPIVEKVEKMPNIILEGPCDWERLLVNFSSRVWKENYQGIEVIVKLGEAYQQVESRHWLVSAMVKEGGFSQDFGILVLFRSDERLLIKLSQLGHPRSTWGVKRSVWRMSKIIREVYPELKVIVSTVSGENEIRPEI